MLTCEQISGDHWQEIRKVELAVIIIAFACWYIYKSSPRVQSEWVKDEVNEQA